METIKIYCNDILLETDESTSVRLNRSLSDPTRINGKTSDYSYSFTLPATPVNNRAFGFANHLNSSAKFSKRYDGKVYSGEYLMFEGTLMLNSFDASEQQYSCNLVNIKVLTVDDIFGDSTMYDLEWYEPYSGTPTINSYNASGDSEVYYPLVAYGVFEKNPYFSDEVHNDYTDRLLLDKSTLYYHETFVPSMNYFGLVRRCFAQKGYEVNGDILEDDVLRNLYLSVSLPNEQIPTYNLANPKLGSVDLTINWSNSGRTSGTLVDALNQDLDWPYAKLKPPTHGGGSGVNDGVYQFKEIEFYNVFDSGSSVVTENIQSYLFDAGEQCIVIPADGAYRFDIEVSATLDTSFNNGKLTGSTEFWTGQESSTQYFDIVYDQDILETCPIEIQLVRNVVNEDGQIELIKSKNNYIYRQTTMSGQSGTTNVTCYPHENPYQAEQPTKETTSGLGWQRGSSRRPYDTYYGYVYNDGTIMAYDPRVSKNFICGFSTYGGANMAVIKNGHSWYKGYADYCDSFYNQSGYTSISKSGSTATTYDSNTYVDAPTSTVSINGNTLTGHLYCTVWLNRNDLVTLNVVHRYYETTATTSTYENRYKSSMTARLKMNALTPRSYSWAREDNLGYNSDSQFDTDLRLGNFLSSGETMASFVDNFINTFNLEYQQIGNTITLNRGKINKNQLRNFVDVDDAAAWSDQQWEKIDFPREIGVKYSDDKDSWGFWTTVPHEHHNDYNWKDFGDTGYDIIKLDTDSTSTNVVSNSLTYCYYQPFTLVEYDGNGDESGATALNLPVIGKYSVFAEGANYEEAMKDDSWSEKQRCWFRGSSTGKQVKIQNEDEWATIYVPEGVYDGLENSYHSSGDTMLTRYFNLINDATLDKLEVEVALTPMEYQMVSNGAYVKFDQNIYQCCEVSGYDPSGEEPATLTLVRK